MKEIESYSIRGSHKPEFERIECREIARGTFHAKAKGLKPGGWVSWFTHYTDGTSSEKRAVCGLNGQFKLSVT